MEIILIFTSQKAMDVNGEVLPWPLAKIPIHSIPVTPDKKFLIAYDGINDPSIITSALQNTPVSRLYVMHHSDPAAEVLANLKTTLDALKIAYQCPFLHSEHTNLSTYGKVPDIGIFSTNKQLVQLEEIFDDLIIELSGDPVLEAKLNILHLLLTADTLDKGQKNELDEYIKQAGKKEELIAAITAFTEKSGPHFERLTVLRNQFLNEY